MKYPKYSKIMATILIQVFFMLNISWAEQADVLENNGTHTLAPALQISNNAYFLPYYNVDVVKPWNKLDVLLKTQKKEEGYFNNTIHVSFRYDQVGILSQILKAVNPDGDIIWFEMGQNKDLKIFKLGIITKTKKQRSLIMDKIKKIDDLPQQELKKIKTRKWVLTLAVSDKGAVLANITAYLAHLHINVSKFLIPNLMDDGKSQFVFELDVPNYLDIDLLKTELSLFSIKGDGSIQITSGQLIDRILDDFLIKKMDIEVNKEARKDLRIGLQTVAARHISQARKDRRTPFIMHPVEIAKIISNEINMFTPELLVYFSKSLKIKKEKVILTILMTILLHDAVEDGDITQTKLYIRFGKIISEIVRMVTKTPQQRDKMGERVYLNNLVKRTDTIGLIAQIVKIADRIHNLRTLQYNTPEFQRKVIFSTIDNFFPEFIEKIDIDKIKNRYTREVFIRAIDLFNNQLKLMMLDLDIDPEQRLKYAWEEECRLNPKVLAMAEKNNIIAHGAWSEKGGIDNFCGIIKQGYILAKSTKVGMAVFAGLLRRQHADEDYDDYQAESSGPYGPYYVLLDSKVNDRRIRVELEKRKVVLPGYYQAMQIDSNVWGINNDFHLAYLVPADTDRLDIEHKLWQAVENNELSSQDVLKAMAKIITYAEFLASNGSLKPQIVSPLKPQTVSSVIFGWAEQSI